MLRYFKPLSKGKQNELGLPSSVPGIDPASVRNANDSIAKSVSGAAVELSSDSDTPANKAKGMKRGPYGVYPSDMRAKIGRYAAEMGVVAAARRFSKELSRPVNESTVRGMKKAYLLQLNQGADVNPGPITDLPQKCRGRPLLLGNEGDERVRKFVTALRDSGGPISTSIVIAATKGLLRKCDPPLLKDFGGPIILEKTWARSLLQRMNFTKRKGTKAAKHRPDDLDELGGKFYRRIGRRVRKLDIPDELIINWDQTAVEVIPCGNWTMNERGEKQVEIKGIDDKRQYTALLACSLSGEMLPPQIIYQGTTERCHPHVDFPDDWDIWHSSSHWSTTDTMVRYVQKIITPYVRHVQQELGTASPPLLIFDVFAAHRTEQVSKAVEELGAACVFVPPRCTDEFQPLDATVNGKYKQLMRSEFQRWFAERVAVMVEEGRTTEEIAGSVDLRTATIKPVHAKWLMNTHELMCNEKELVKQGFAVTGIANAVQQAREAPILPYDDSDVEDGEWDE